MIIDLNRNLFEDAGLPIGPVKAYTGYSLVLDIVGVPSLRAGARVRGVAVTIKNADGLTLTVPCVREGRAWSVLVAAPNFAHYGVVQNGVSIDLELEAMGGAVYTERVGVGQLIVISTGASEGDPSSFYVYRGDRLFVRSRLVDGVQHYVEQVMSYDPEIGWGADWTGDYILSEDGEFIPANNEED